MSAHLHDDRVLMLSGAELIQASQLVQIAIKVIERRDATTVSIGWVNLMRRGANTTEQQMSQSRRKRVTSPPPEAVSAESTQREVSVIEAAEILGVTPRHLYRLIKAGAADLLLAIARESPLRLDRSAIEAYAADRQHRKAA